MPIYLERIKGGPTPPDRKREQLHKSFEAIATGEIPTTGREHPVRFTYIPGSSSLQEGYIVEVHNNAELAVSRLPGGGLEVVFRLKPTSVGLLQLGRSLGWAWEAGSGFVRCWPHGEENDALDSLDELMRAAKCNKGIVDLHPGRIPKFRSPKAPVTVVKPRGAAGPPPSE